jgi:hypothetical protein
MVSDSGRLIRKTFTVTGREMNGLSQSFINDQQLEITHRESPGNAKLDLTGH